MILDTMPDGVCIIDQHNEVICINPEMEHAWGAPAGRKCFAYFGDRDQPCPHCCRTQIVAGQTLRWEWRTDDGQKTYEVVGSALHNLDGATATLYIFHDVTAQAHARREIEEMSMKSTRQAEQLRLAHAQLSARARELATLLHISHALAATLEVQPLLDKILDQMYTMIAYRSAIPYLVEDENIIAAAYRGPLPDKQVIGVQIPLTSMPGCDDLTRCQRPVVIDDLQCESDMAQAIRQATQRYFPEAMQATHAWMSVPLLINSTTARRFISARQAVSAPLTKTRNVISFMRCARMRRPTPHMSQHNINVGARCRNLEVHPMFRRSVLHRLLATVLLLFLLAACGGAGGDSAAAANNVATNARFAEQQAHGIHGWLAASTPPSPV